MVGGTAFDRENPPDRLVVRRVGAQSINRFGGERDELAARE